MVEIKTETKDPHASSQPKDQNTGKLVRDKDGHWHLLREQQEDTEDRQIAAATSLDEMLVANIIAQSSIKLAQAGCGTPRLDAEVLMMFVLGVSREELVKNWTKKLKPDLYEQYKQVLLRRMKREPIAYIIGYKEFYGTRFMVDNRVLIPRPETELMVDKVLNYVKKWEYGQEQLTVADVGTGCGCIAVCVAKAVNFVKIFAIDSSESALEVARVNAGMFGLEKNIAFLHGDLLLPLPHPVHIIAANLPYISEARYPQLEPEITQYEPKSALVSGPTGLEFYDRLLSQAPQFLLHNGIMLFEIDPEQLAPMRGLILKYLPQAKLEVLKDGLNLARVVIAQM
ncbi:MAG TPA: peptide chain release factor N(5)-glutamine methyltransferase [bacterium]|nr:peptide chain release factor N(5)-glutamine methyltransferase [bacterium]